MFNWWLRCDCRGVLRFYISFNLFAINFCWTSVYLLNMCRENEPIKEMLTTAENRNNLATIKAATTKNWHTHGEREMERVAREGERQREMGGGWRGRGAFLWLLAKVKPIKWRTVSLLPPDIYTNLALCLQWNETTTVCDDGRKLSYTGRKNGYISIWAMACNGNEILL